MRHEDSAVHTQWYDCFPGSCQSLSGSRLSRLIRDDQNMVLGSWHFHPAAIFVACFQCAVFFDIQAAEVCGLLAYESSLTVQLRARDSTIQILICSCTVVTPDYHPFSLSQLDLHQR